MVGLRHFIVPIGGANANRKKKPCSLVLKGAPHLVVPCRESSELFGLEMLYIELFLFCLGNHIKNSLNTASKSLSLKVSKSCLEITVNVAQYLCLFLYPFII